MHTDPPRVTIELNHRVLADLRRVVSYEGYLRDNNRLNDLNLLKVNYEEQEYFVLYAIHFAAQCAGALAKLNMDTDMDMFEYDPDAWAGELS